MSSSDNRSRRSEVELRCTPTWTIIEGMDFLDVPGVCIEDLSVPTFENTNDKNAFERIRKGMEAELTARASEYAQQADSWKDCVDKAVTYAKQTHSYANFYFKFQVDPLKMFKQSASGQVQSIASSESNSKTQEESELTGVYNGESKDLETFVAAFKAYCRPDETDDGLNQDSNC